MRPWEPGEGPQRYIRELEAEIDRLRAAVKWTREVRPGKTKDGSAVVEMTWDQFNTMRALACVQQPPCKRCGGKGEYTVEITNHGERNEFFQEVCNDCGGGPVQSAPKYKAVEEAAKMASKDVELLRRAVKRADPKSLPEAPDPAWPATCSVCGVNPPSFWNRLIENFSCTPCFVRDADSQ